MVIADFDARAQEKTPVEIFSVLILSLGAHDVILSTGRAVGAGLGIAAKAEAATDLDVLPNLIARLAGECENTADFHAIVKFVAISKGKRVVLLLLWAAFFRKHAAGFMDSLHLSCGLGGTCELFFSGNASLDSDSWRAAAAPALAQEAFWQVGKGDLVVALAPVIAISIWICIKGVAEVGVGFDAEFEFDDAFFRQTQGFHQNDAARELGGEIGREGLVDGDALQQVGWKEVELDRFFGRIRAGDEGTVDERVRIAVSQPANHGVFAADDIGT